MPVGVSLVNVDVGALIIEESLKQDCNPRPDSENKNSKETCLDLLNISSDRCLIDRRRQWRSGSWRRDGELDELFSRRKAVLLIARARIDRVRGARHICHIGRRRPFGRSGIGEPK